MRTKEEVLMNVFKENCTERIYKFQKVVNHDLIYKAMQEYAEEYHRAELLKLRQPPVKGSLLTDCMYYNLADRAMCQNKNICINCQNK